MDEIISLLFVGRDIAHALHLRTKSFAQHVALNGFYIELEHLADKVAETYQGRYGILQVDVKKYGQTAPFSPTDSITFIRTFCDWAQKARSVFKPEDTGIVNIWDDILTMALHTKYKLENLA